MKHPTCEITMSTMLKILAFVPLLAVFVLYACDENVYFGTGRVNQPPNIYIIHGPHEGDNTVYQVHFYWLGDDPDGVVDHYEYVIVTGDPIGFDPADTTGTDKWTKTELTDIEFEVTADEEDTTVIINYNPYARFTKHHTFFVRAVDNDGMRSRSVYRSFNAFTLAPHMFITEPASESSHDTQYLTPVIFFKWKGKDPIDDPANYQKVDYVRYFHTAFYGRIVEDLNDRPEIFEDKWSPWFAFNAPGDSGNSTILGDDELLEFNRSYIFVVQGMDEAGAISSIFDEKSNIRRFMIKKPTGPVLQVFEPFLGISTFLGTYSNVVTYNTPAGFPVNFSWHGDASDYGAIVSTYRYGWDITDLNDPNEWDVQPNPYTTVSQERNFLSGVHSLYIEAVDNIGVITLAKIEINIVPVNMERDLLLVDDLMSSDFPQIIYAIPTEHQDDEFWLDICSKVKTFDPTMDIYDTADWAYEPPDIKQLWRYKNIIWNYGAARWDFNAWMKTVKFMPEGEVGGLGTKYTYNILTYYFALGGHVWTSGISDRIGGLAASIPSKSWRWDVSENLIFPLYLRCEMLQGPTGGCPDTVGATSMAYRDYCVSVIDKAYGVFRWNVIPLRNPDFDALARAYRADDNPMTSAHPDLPEELHLWEEITKPNRFFDPRVRGFHYLEIYDPRYWMKARGIYSRPCFHPMYRMRTRNSKSIIDNSAIAFWTTTHADIISNAPGAVAAPSVHFGIPLWFFDHDAVHAIADVIFREWGLPVEE